MKTGKVAPWVWLHWMGQEPSTVGSDQENLVVIHARNAVLSMQLEAVPVASVEASQLHAI